MVQLFNPQVSKHFLTLLFFALFTLPALTANAQENAAQDSLISYLQLFADHQVKDSILLEKVLRLSREIDPEIFVSEEFIKVQANLKANLPDDQYYAINQILIGGTCYSDNDKQEFTINYGMQFVEELKLAKSQLLHFFFLKTLRDLRVPYRNSHLIYEGIEKYSDLASEYLQRNDSNAVSIAYNVIASLYQRIGLSDKAVYFQLKSIDYLNNKVYPIDSSAFGYRYPPNIGLSGIVNRKAVLGYMLNDAGKYQEALHYLYEAATAARNFEASNYSLEVDYTYLNLAKAHLHLNNDSTEYYLQLIKQSVDQQSASLFIRPHYYLTKAYSEYFRDELDSAEVHIQMCFDIIKSRQLQLTNISGTLTPSYVLALIRIKQNRIPEAIAILPPEIAELQSLNLRNESLKEMKLLAEAYALHGDDANAAKSYSAYIDLQNKMIEEERNNQSISFDIEKKMTKNEEALRLLEAENKYAQKRQYYLIGILILTALIIFGLYTRNQFRKKVNRELLDKNQEIEATLRQLKSTQSQLIQSEKMASLGELTAGIAHEIQNPLNFVNNFSEINTELIDELMEAANKGESQEVIALSHNIRENEEKIVHHGKRADAIVKGMLQHSRSGSGEKEPTNINELADEYLRLAYHGLRAKEKSFNATLETHYDRTIGKINIVQQDIGRVLLNIITNAFWAVNEKRKSADSTYQPTVHVSTSRENGTISIHIRDNGNGIPSEIADKIFQPFFTTKPAGQGTGLGLSLSYDIMKAHGGDITVHSDKGQGTKFIIRLPTS